MPDNENEQSPQVPSESSNSTNPPNPDEPCYSAFSDALKNQVPDSVTFGLASPPSPKSKDEIVDKDNDRASAAIIKAYTDHEIARVKRQKWLLLVIVLLTAGQLIFFNYLIYFTITKSFQTAQLEAINTDVIDNLFTILKYYIGATIVELIGMIWFITKGTFSSDHVKTMQSVLAGKTSKQNEETR